MPLIDREGRLFGRLNVFDLFVVCVVVALAAIAYFKLSAPHRVAPPFALASERVVAEVELQLPAEQPWLCDYAQPGTGEQDPRTGLPSVEVLGCGLREGFHVVALRVHGVRDGDSPLLFEGAPLVPGRHLEINTEVAILSGVVRSTRIVPP